MEQKQKAELLRRLHYGPEILVLPNAWDAGSARVIESVGFPAIASSSSGCAAVLGYMDGEIVPRSEMMLLLRRIVAMVDVPVTADLEAGYGDPAGTAREAIEAGAVGLNFEDIADGEFVSLLDQVERIRKVRAAADSTGIPLVINARTDIFWVADGDEETRFDRAVERLNAYRAAGADCLFVPGVRDAETIGLLAQRVKGPLNVLAAPGSPSITEMKGLGVARVSFGGGPSRIAMGALRSFANELRQYGTFAALANDAIPGPEMQGLLRRL
jgi:2-methylisocitrate lyase-like PEP mutase family enzyme